MGIFSKRAMKVDLKHVEGKGFDVIKEVSIDDECLVLKQKFNKNASVMKLKLDKVVGILETTDTEIKVKSKSILGRAVVGGIILGPVGSIVGGISGTSDKVKKNIKFLLVINYLDSSSEVQALVLEELPGRFNLSKFAKELKEKCNVKMDDNKEEIYL